MRIAPQALRGDAASAALGAALLAAWATASASGTHAVSAGGGAAALAALAAPSARAPPAARYAAARGLVALLGAGERLPKGAADALVASAADALSVGDMSLAAAATRALTLATSASAAGQEGDAAAAAAALAPLMPRLAAALAAAAADAANDDGDSHRAASLECVGAGAVAALARRGELGAEARRAWMPLLLTWATEAAVAAAADGPHDADADATSDACGAPSARRAGAQEALRCASAGPSAAAAAAAHSWLAALLKALATGSSGWAPRVVADDAAAAAVAAAAALDAAVTAAEPPPAAAPGSEQRRFYGWLPPAAPATPPATPAPPPTPAALAASAAVAAASARALHVGVKALAVLLAAEPSLAPAALDAGALTLLSRLTSPAELHADVDAAPRSDAAASASEPPEGLRRQVARCVAALSLLPAASEALRTPPWRAWLAHAARAAADAPPPVCSGTRKLASHAARAQLNAAATAPGAPPGAPRFADGLFFFVPTAPNLAPGGPACAPEHAPAMDIVFVHGLRGGPYGTWRVGPPPDDADAAAASGAARRRARAPLWPADWLTADVPEARVLSLGFRTRYSDWEGATHGLEALADALLERLTAARVGADGRPLVLVGHSLGGVLIKLMLARAGEHDAMLDADGHARHAALRGALRGAVFFSCPHFGSRLAELGAWRVLRPAPGVAELRPGNAARLEALNDTLRAAHKRAGVRVLSFLEGTPTRLLRVPVFRGRHIAAEVVAMESAYPGFGELVVLPDSDHIDACKVRVCACAALCDAWFFARMLTYAPAYMAAFEPRCAGLRADAGAGA
jgi:hypothetical protein